MRWSRSKRRKNGVKNDAKELVVQSTPDGSTADHPKKPTRARVPEPKTIREISAEEASLATPSISYRTDALSNVAEPLSAGIARSNVHHSRSTRLDELSFFAPTAFVHVQQGHLFFPSNIFSASQRVDPSHHYYVPTASCLANPNAYPRDSVFANQAFPIEQPFLQSEAAADFAVQQARAGPELAHSTKATPQARVADCDEPAATTLQPMIFYSHGMKVSMLDWETKIFVIDLVAPEVCDLIRRRTDEFVHSQSRQRKPSWRTLYTYTKMDIPIREVQGLDRIMQLIFHQVSVVIGDVFTEPRAASFLRPRSWKEPHILKYQKVPGKPEHLGVESHFDGSHFTWSLMLSGHDEYRGGGTFFRCLRHTLKLGKGQILVHAGNLYHSGVSIEEGTRQLVVCFMDGFNPGIEDRSPESDDHKGYQQQIFRLHA